MNTLLKHGLNEYRSHKVRHEQFLRHSRRAAALLETAGIASPETHTLMLTPLIEIAWVDGRVGRPEQNAILEAADIYGLLDDEGVSMAIMDRMVTRPVRGQLEAWWADLGKALQFIPISQMAAITVLLLEQTRFIAALGQKRIFGLWRGYGAGHEEVAALDGMESRFSAISEGRADATPARAVHADDFVKVLPLIKVAWADGRISKRERQMIFDSLFDLGVQPTNENLRQLLEWLELKPDDDFFAESIRKLREGFESLGPDERADIKYSILSQCTLVAEVSGSDPGVPGGNRISREETETVKHIARLLSGAVHKN